VTDAFPAKDIAVRVHLVIMGYFEDDEFIAEFLICAIRFNGLSQIVIRPVARFLGRTPTRIFLLYPVVIVAWEALLRSGRLEITPAYSALMAIGYILHKFSTTYRDRHGGVTVAKSGKKNLLA